MYYNLWDIYTSLDTRSKRCVVINLYSVLFIILPSRLFLSKGKCLLWSILLVYMLYIVDGPEDRIISPSNHCILNTKKRYNLI